ncbi:hypothetical protein GCM10027290_29900 [Micromonospora sonneratiae]|uniref:Uncharacterized protein n=1 Tax=Micromonospora sonneratiae TaxID=1184706 RepID=A0ABW3YJN6_9ACTN
MNDDKTPEGYYRSFLAWESGDRDLLAVRPLVAEMIGAGVVAADSSDAYWAGGGNQRGLGRSWRRGQGRCEACVGAPGGLPPPARTRQYDPEQVHEIALVLLEPELEIDHEYLPDGAVTFAVTGRPRAVFRVPVVTMNRVMRQDGRSRGRWLVNLVDIASCIVRGSVLEVEGADPLAQEEDFTGSDG